MMMMGRTSAKREDIREEGEDEEEVVVVMILGVDHPSSAIISKQHFSSAVNAIITMASLKMAQDVCKHITSKRIELESPGCSGFKDY